MGITFYTPPPEPHDEDDRGRAVLDSGALHVVDDPELGRLVERARKLIGTSMAAISIIYEEWQYLVAASGIAPGVYGRRTSFCGHALSTPSDVLCVPDAGDDVRFAGNPSVMDGMLRFYVGVPLRDTRGQPLGALCAFDPIPRPPLEPRVEQQLRDLSRAVLTRLAELKQPVVELKQVAAIR